MNVKTTAEIQALSSAALRAYAKEIGVARRADDTKATLAARVITKAAEMVEEIVETVAVTPIEATTEETLELLADVAAQADEVADYAAKLKAAKKANKCTICFARTVGTGKGSDPKHAKSMGYCAPCLEEAEWENTHSDEDHDAALKAWGLEIGQVTDSISNPGMAACWICRPELNEAQKGNRKVTTGRSRAGMKIWAKGTYLHKSALVAEAIKVAGGTSKIRTAKDGSTTDLTATLNGTEITMGWDGNAFAYGERSLINGKQVRNVAAALRVIASLKK